MLTYALFPQVGLKFLQNKDNPDAFEPVPTGKAAAVTNDAGEELYTVEVEGKSYTVTVANGGDVSAIIPAGQVAPAASAAAPALRQLVVSRSMLLWRALWSRCWSSLVRRLLKGESIVILEAMKMETSVSAPAAGTIVEVRVQAGDSCAVGDVLVTLA